MLPIIKRIHGVSSNFLSDIVQLPGNLGGIGIPNLYLISITIRFKILTSSIQRNIKLGKNFKILLETQQLEAGIISFILRIKNAFTRKYITNTWLTSLFASLHHLGFHLDYDNWLPHSKEETVMDTVHCFRLDVHQIQLFNKVRLAFQILYSSDAYSLKGTSILPFHDKGFVRSN